jgi:hypothetical protein
MLSNIIKLPKCGYTKLNSDGQYILKDNILFKSFSYNKYEISYQFKVIKYIEWLPEEVFKEKMKLKRKELKEENIRKVNNHLKSKILGLDPGKKNIYSITNGRLIHESLNKKKYFHEIGLNKMNKKYTSIKKKNLLIHLIEKNLSEYEFDDYEVLYDFYN